MATKSYSKCIETKDWETAVKNFEQTTPRWKSYWFECLKELYSLCEDFAKKYILNPITKTIEVITATIETVKKRIRRTKYDDMIDANGFDIYSEGEELCYLFEFYDAEGGLVCSKVGTTTRTIRQRLKEELCSKTYKEMGVAKAIVKRIYECRELPAEGLESLIRSEYIKKYPKSFKKNDRFIGEYFDFNACDEIAYGYLN